MDDIFEQMVGAMKRGESFVFVEVLQTSGSTPGKEGFKMLVFDDRTLGTVGGGSLEKGAIDKARDMMNGSERIRIEDVDLREERMMCGGSVKLLFERFGPGQRMTIFGAGHVAKALAGVGKICGFGVRVIDDREDLLSGFDGCETVSGSGEEMAREIDMSNDFVVIMTKSHDEDFRILLEILKRDHAPTYLGVVGSERKAQEFTKALGDEKMKRVRMPVGIDIGSQTAGEIAVSIMADIIRFRNGAS
jgi:xanthine dehydrogenase accessory factor